MRASRPATEDGTPRLGGFSSACGRCFLLAEDPFQKARDRLGLGELGPDLPRVQGEAVPGWRRRRGRCRRDRERPRPAGRAYGHRLGRGRRLGARQAWTSE